LVEDIIEFNRILQSAGIKSNVRWSTKGGRGVNGACGQLILNDDRGKIVNFDIENIGFTNKKNIINKTIDSKETITNKFKQIEK